MIIVRLIRADKVNSAILELISANMSTEYVHPPAFDLLASYEKSNYTTPILFLLSAGADPMIELRKLA